VLNECKVCYICKESKGYGEFPVCSTVSDGRHSYCSVCHRAKSLEYYYKNREKQRDQRLRRTYGISLHEYGQMLTMQASGCAVCGIIDPTKTLNVDHCHQTGAVRGLLCQTCNSGLGHFRDDPELMERAASYIRDSMGGDSDSEFR
jgi:hypothetical protein